MTEIGDELRKELSECTINVANLIEQKNAEIARLQAERDELLSENGKLANYLGAENLRLRAALEGTLTVIDEMQKLSPAAMGPGFQKWRDEIIKALAEKD